MLTGQTADRAKLNSREQTEDSSAAGEQNCVNVHLVATKGGAAADVLGKWRRCQARLGTYIKYDSCAQRKCDKTDDDNVHKQQERDCGQSVGYYGK